jgi:hypothetical protein
MAWDLDGVRIAAGADTFPRVTITAQYLTSLANRQFTMRVPRVQGLISFNYTILTRTRPNRPTPRFEDGIKGINPDGSGKLWDCLLIARETLLTAKTKYPNATLRIIVSCIMNAQHVSDLPLCAGQSEVRRNH